MTGSHGASEPRPRAGAAFAAYQAGRSGEAEAIGRAILAHDPRDAGAHYVCGLVAADRGALESAREAFETAAALAPGKASLRITLGNLALRQGDEAAAERAFRTALAQAPGSVAAHTNLGAALKRQGRLEEAVESYRAGLALYRGSAWWGADPAAGRAVLEPAQQESFRTASRAKLEFDLAQIDHLLARGLLPSALAAGREGLQRVLAGFGSEDRPGAPRALSEAEQRLIGPVYNRVIYRPPEEATGPALDPRLDAGRIERRYHGTTPSVAVVDNLLSAPALAALQRFCWEATIWFDCKEHGGYLGAYLHEGFDHPVLIALARELGQRLSGIVAGAPLHADVGVQLRPGGGRHAQARGQGRRQRQTSGSRRTRPAPTRRRQALPSTTFAAPPDWGFSDYNLDPARLEHLVEREGRSPVRVPYRCNRAVIFDSSLIHESGGVAFRAGPCEPADHRHAPLR